MEPDSKVLFLSYNRIQDFRRYPNGWLCFGTSRKALLFQDGDLYLEEAGFRCGMTSEQRRAFKINYLWLQAKRWLQDIDELVIYIGDRGYEVFFELLQGAGFPSDKVVFVSCSCRVSEKAHLVAKNCPGAQLITGDGCGGASVMRVTLEQFIKTGMVRHNESA